MKKENPIRTLLGIKQQDAAMLLGVSRGHWSMFESGKRDLPLPAKQLLAEMLAYIQSAETTARPVHPARQKASIERLERLLRENEYQLLLAARKITVATEKQQAQERLELLAEFLASRQTTKGSAFAFPNTITRKAKQSAEVGDTDTVAELQHKKELLELEKLLLQSQLRNVSKDSGIIRN